MTDRQRLRRDLLAAIATLALMLAWEVSGWDRAVARWFGSAAGFAWRDAWWTRTVLHDGGRWLALGVLLLFGVDSAYTVTPGPPRGERLFWLAVAIAATLVVPAIKRVSLTSCPWDLQEFGGAATYVSHWQWGVRDGGPGHCFPSGHAVTAFAFFSLYFLWRPYRPVLARRMLGAVVGLGVVLGLTQLVRGAHFPSHVFWSAWLCWALCVVTGAARQALAWRVQREGSSILTSGLDFAGIPAEPSRPNRR